MKVISIIDPHMHFLEVEFFFCNRKYVMYLYIYKYIGSKNATNLNVMLLKYENIRADVRILVHVTFTALLKRPCD